MNVKNVTGAWLDLVTKINNKGIMISPRGIPCKEILGNQTRVAMTDPILETVERNLGYGFMAAEAAWILSGDNRLANIEKYSKFIWEFSDDGHYYSGAYGPMVVDQLTYICDMLEEDHDTRQSLLTIWRPNPRASRDIPCTISLQWVLRDNKLHCIDTMRSSDAWLGWPYDMFNISMLSGMILLMLRDREYRGTSDDLIGDNDWTWCDVELGDIIMTAGSSHIYASNEAAIKLALADPREYNADKFNWTVFNGPEHLILHLQHKAAILAGAKREAKAHILENFFDVIR